jgi:hypothetical protein
MGVGRPRGSVNKRTAAYLRTNGGDLPLDYMLRIMRDDQQPRERRDDMAKAAAPYLHAKLQSIQMDAEITSSKVIRAPETAREATTWTDQYAPHTEH